MVLRFPELSLLFAQTTSGLELAPVTAGLAGVGMQVLTMIGVGLLIAIALQVLLFILGSAIAVTLLPLPTFTPSETTAAESAPALPIGTLAGLGILSTVNFVLFIASFLAIALIQCHQPRWGAIAGIVLWAVYFLLITWLSFRALNSWSETVLTIATAGMRRFIAWLVAPFQSVPTPPPPSAIQTLWQQLQQYLQQADVKQLASKPLEQTLHQYFAACPIAHVPLAAQTFQIDDLQPILTARPDLSEKKQARILRQIHTVWATYTQDLPTAPPRRSQHQQRSTGRHSHPWPPNSLKSI